MSDVDSKRFYKIHLLSKIWQSIILALIVGYGIYCITAYYSRQARNDEIEKLRERNLRCIELIQEFETRIQNIENSQFANPDEKRYLDAKNSAQAKFLKELHNLLENKRDNPNE